MPGIALRGRPAEERTDELAAVATELARPSSAPARLVPRRQNSIGWPVRCATPSLLASCQR